MTPAPGDKDFWWLFDATAEAMLLADTEGTILARNASSERLFGYVGDEWAGLTIEKLLPERLRAAHKGMRAEFAAQPSPRAMGRKGEFFGLRKNGTEFPVRISLSPVPGADGPVVLAIIEDITIQRQTEQALRENTRQLRERETQLGLAVRVTGLAFWEWNPYTGTVYLSPDWKALLGYSEDELSNNADHWRTLFYADDFPALEAMVDDYSAGSQREVELQYRLRHRDGSFRWMRSRTVALPAAEGEGVRLLGMQWDVTDKVIAARQVGESREELANLRQLQVALETAAAIAHELNQPLNAVVTYCDAAQLLASQRDTERLGEALSAAVAAAGRASRVVRDLLVSLDQNEIPLAALDINEVVRDAVALLEADEDPGCRVALSLAPDLPRVLGSDIQIKRVLSSLLRNAVEAMAGSGLAADAIGVTVSTADGDNLVKVSVSDSGPGLDPTSAGRAFVPFFTTKPRGIGMGLATSRRIIERLGGRLWFESRPGATTFHFTLPFAP